MKALVLLRVCTEVGLAELKDTSCGFGALITIEIASRVGSRFLSSLELASRSLVFTPIWVAP